MKSGELAQLAGVTVRALRHYHAIGLLPEPPRGENGYRDYTVEDLAHVLRIKRLASLGFSLDRIGEVLEEMDAHPTDGAGSRTSDALDELDRELALQIERLQEQRSTIELLKREQLDPDLPIRFARAIKTLMSGPRADSPIAKADHTAMLLAGHLYTEEDLAELERVVATIEELNLMEQLRALQKRVDELAPDASQEEQDNLVKDIEATMIPLIDCFSYENWEGDYEPTELLMIEALHRGLNEAQAQVSDRIERILEDRILAKKADS
ncbi:MULTISPECIES: MerR family transcriptional regulator [Gordonibacter]|uniref:MerR family transcriptional regulator n=1 Tax=Gordonibacter faecis TaxID=3047475 RepID=A0ABT7DJM6_9ACTN|nr:MULTISPECIES: MerR family transcriptional regulator [unclassified Gordonibacter]MDJ1649725.1 MerR family transcriptional regulator [Gordonibacter sp. KGMB12511]HIW76529.1 MerR family transcriptional regulator [Candidatus Gordonibacter avicola]